MFKIGDTFELRNLNNNEQLLKTKIIEIDENNLYIQEPVDPKTNKSVYLARGDKFEVTYRQPDSAVYMFKSEILMSISGAMPMFVLRKPKKDEIKRVQRRNYVRVDAILDMQFHPLDDEFTPFKAYSLNISGGGIAVSLPTNHGLEPNMKAKIQFKLPMAKGNKHEVEVLGQVIRIMKKKNANDKASIEFLDLQSVDQRNIIRYTFEQQLAGRKTKFR
ncbi:flagellar brake protein [Bacillus solimangrovi]|uniref:flagellar brake protein n=1 Tax=Bacillus solimangrovi TaxID=1305675 RepID=UPI001112CDF8|nr:PilZ domain-containing protein [Bacillus solimangrovi]